MQPEAKRNWLDRAEIFDSLRVYPRLIMAVYLTLLAWLTVYFPVSYFGVPPEQRTVAMTAFASVVLTAAYGALPFMTKIYMDNGRDWNARTAPAPAADPQAAP